MQQKLFESPADLGKTTCSWYLQTEELFFCLEVVGVSCQECLPRATHTQSWAGSTSSVSLSSLGLKTGPSVTDAKGN